MELPRWGFWDGAEEVESPEMRPLGGAEKVESPEMRSWDGAEEWSCRDEALDGAEKVELPR